MFKHIYLIYEVKKLIGMLLKKIVLSAQFHVSAHKYWILQLNNDEHINVRILI